MRVARIMHVETDLLNGIGNVRASESDVLESSGYAAIVKGIRIWTTTSGSYFWFSVYGCGRRLAVSHTSPGENVKNILTLGEM
jgi:hypothetical protein